MRVLRIVQVLSISILVGCGCGNSTGKDENLKMEAENSLASSGTWRLVWNDEFEGDILDSSKWISENGPGPWGLNELEYYTNGKNIKVMNGNLVVEARKESFGGRSFTSGRIRTAATWTYGKIEARIKLPFGQGMFPAFWLLSNEYETPDKYGEIDILEMVGSTTGSENATVWGSAHRPDVESPSKKLKSVSDSYSTPDWSWFNDEFHVFGIEWSRSKMKFYVDDTVYQIVRINEDGSDGWSALQQPMFMILNLAIGGDWAKAPDADTIWPQQMLVDWVRVYQKKSYNESLHLPGSSVQVRESSEEMEKEVK